jgi:hypothetical protein
VGVPRDADDWMDIAALALSCSCRAGPDGNKRCRKGGRRLLEIVAEVLRELPRLSVAPWTRFRLVTSR